MKKNQTYRLLNAFFLVALVTQVFVLQSVHHVFDHHDHGEYCGTEGVHMHSSEHAHFSCDICMFQFAPTEIVDSDLIINDNKLVIADLEFSSQKYHFTQKYLQTNLRGPPSIYDIS